jgi:hypothetical protein
VDVATTAAEKALAAQGKAAYGSMTAQEDEQNNNQGTGVTLGGAANPRNPTAAQSAAGSQANRAGGRGGPASMGKSAVVTG